MSKYLKIKIEAAIKAAQDLGYQIDFVLVPSEEIYEICKDVDNYTIRGVKVIADNRHLGNNFILLKRLKL